MNCWKCGANNADDCMFCEECGADLRKPPVPPAPNPAQTAGAAPPVPPAPNPAQPVGAPQGQPAASAGQTVTVSIPNPKRMMPFAMRALQFLKQHLLAVILLLLAPVLNRRAAAGVRCLIWGALLLRLLSPFYFFFCINQIYSAALRGAGNSQVPMWIMLGSFVVFRQIYLYIVAHYVSNEIIPIAMSYPAGWFVCSVATLIYYRFCKFDSHRLVEDV